MSEDQFPPFPAAGLQREDVLVRWWDPGADAADRNRLIRDPDADRWGMPLFVTRPVDAAAMRVRLERDLEQAHAGSPTTYAVVSASTGQLLGDVAWRLDLPRMQIADVGYGTLPEARGRGVARTALGLLAGWLLDERDGPGMARVQLDHATGNPASCRVALAAGFEREGIRRAFLPLCDPDTPQGWARHDVCMHGRVAGDVAPF